MKLKRADVNWSAVRSATFHEPCDKAEKMQALGNRSRPHRHGGKTR